MATTKASEDNRADKHPIAVKVVPVTIDPAVDVRIGETDVLLNGEIIGFIYDSPSLDGAATDYGFKLEDKDDIEYHSKASLVQNTATLEQLLPGVSPERFGFAGMATLQVTASGDQTSTNDINVTVIMR